MAIVSRKSNFYGSVGVSGYTEPNAAARDGHLHVLQGRVYNSLTDSSGSKYLLCDIPWNAILLPRCAFYTKDWGFAQAVIGTEEVPNGLLDAARGVASAGQLPISIFSGTKWAKQLWELVGLTALPNTGPAKLYATAAADADVAGNLAFSIEYALHL